MTIARGARVLTSDGVEIGHVDRLMQRRGSPPCLYLSLERAARSEPTPVIVTAADVTVEDGQVRLRHVAHRDLDVTSWARGGGLHADERPPSRLEGERPQSRAASLLPQRSAVRDDVRSPVPAPLRWWVLLVVALAMTALAVVGREAPVRALDVQPVADPQTIPTLTRARAA